MYVPQHPWLNKACKVLLQKLVSQVPIAGPILSDIVTIIWPTPPSPDPTAEDIFNQIREHIDGLFDEKFPKLTRHIPTGLPRDSVTLVRLTNLQPAHFLPKD